MPGSGKGGGRGEAPSLTALQTPGTSESPSRDRKILFCRIPAGLARQRGPFRGRAEIAVLQKAAGQIERLR